MKIFSLILVAFFASVALVTHAFADQFSFIRSDKQFRTLTNTLNFYPQVIMSVSGTHTTYAVAPVSGRVTGFQCVNQGAVGGTVATISPSIGSIYMGIASTTILSTTAIGGVVSSTVTTSNTVAAGEALRLQIGTGITGAGSLNCHFKLDPTLTY
jgi:hypothetical protein